MFLLYVNTKIINTGAELEKRSRFLIQNMDIVGCMDKYLDTVTALFDILLDNESSSEFSVYVQLYRKVSKEYLKLQEKRTRDFSYLTAAIQPLLAQNFPNMFQHEDEQVVRDGTIVDTLNNAAALSSSLYICCWSMWTLCTRTD